MERKIKMKVSYFIKRKRKSNRDVKPHQHRKKVKNISHTKLYKKRARQKLALKHDVFNSKNCLIIRQLDVHRSQHNLESLNFTFHAADRSKHSLFLGIIVQKGIITSIYRNANLKVSVLTPKSTRC